MDDDEWHKIYVTETKSKVLCLSSYNDKEGKEKKGRERENEKEKLVREATDCKSVTKQFSE